MKMGGEDVTEEELSLELSIGGGKYGKTENLRESGIANDFPVSRCDFSGVAVENGCETVDPQRRREIQALRRQEARRKREEKIKKSRRQNAVGFVDDKMFLEAHKFQTRVRDREIREKDCFFEGKNCGDEVSDELGLSLFSEKSGKEKECLFPKVQLVASPVDCGSEYSNGVKSSEQCSSAVSDYHSLSHKGGSSSDTGSHSSPSRLRQIESHDSSSQTETAEHGQGLGEAKLVPQPTWMRAADQVVSQAPERMIAPSSETSKPDAAGSLPHMPCVTATGNGPNGRTVTGFLYMYNKTGVSIMCVCHGSSFSPAEFVAHAGGVDVTHPLKHITIVPSPDLH